MAEVELQQIGSYPVTELLQVGSTSTLYWSSQASKKARNKKDLLIRYFHTPLTTDEAKKTFLKRYKKLKKLTSIFVATVKDADFIGDMAYLVMEKADGEPLRQRITPDTLPHPDEIKPYLSKIADALRDAHSKGVLHGNLHPGALWITAPPTFVNIGDFALFMPELDDLSGAIPYMAPEALKGHPIEHSDQYALAAIVYEWLGGRRPYTATERDALLAQQEKEPLPPLHELNPHVSIAVEEVITRALSYNAADRFAHMLEFSHHYLSALTGFPIKSAAPEQEQPVTPSPLVTPVALVSTNQKVAPERPVPHVPETPRSAAESAPLSDSQLFHTVVADLRQGGILSKSLPGYEERPAQVEMATIVARALSEHVPAVVEAGTGTGKSLAYLLPIVRSGKVALISTANKALQEQLFYKDIPFVQKHIKRFDAALVKGMSNYVCLDRVESERTGIQAYTKNREFRRLLDVIQDPDARFSGDFEALGFQLPADIRGRVAAESDQCAWSKCGFYEQCYVRHMRARAQDAQAIVVNHTLLLLDAAMGGFLLPERDVIVLDEAHHLEEEATRVFTYTITAARIQTLLAQRMLKDHSLMSLQDEAFQASQQLWARVEHIAESSMKGRINLEKPLEEGLILASKIEDLTDSLRKQYPKNLPEKEEQLYEKLVKRAQNLAEELRIVFSVAQAEKLVYYIERTDGPGARMGSPFEVSAAPLDVTDWLKSKLFNKYPVVICTSATLATVGTGAGQSGERKANFTYFRRRVGLEPEERHDVLECILPLAFDYANHALLYLPRHLPQPTFGSGSDSYMKSIAREMYRLVKISRGRAFLLFSSKRMLDRAYELMAPHLEFPLLKQGAMTRLELTRRFRQEEGAVLFGLKSFWEGVDIAGDALSLVVIDKLPFDPPDDPVHEARVAQMKAAGENWFGTYVLPQAVLRLKQGLGRLLRTHDDRGVMALLDTRLHTKGYGRLVLDALPPARRTFNIHDVEQFFAEA
jgi:Rad3-related DNA helicase/serine/threonine protein kinase